MLHNLNQNSVRQCLEYSSRAYRESSEIKHSLVHIRTIIPTEHINEDYVHQLRDKIENDGIWTHPVVVEKASFFLLDGHHRYYIAQMLNLEYIPCVFVDYESPNIDVYCRNTNLLLDKKHILKQFKIDPHHTKEMIAGISQMRPRLRSHNLREVIEGAHQAEAAGVTMYDNLLKHFNG